ncbi:hypothetical protein FRC18_010949 [Serendipita sp. 400]|nr:hypothetical protein FRC18_010949 [Serendipita sp. 400]
MRIALFVQILATLAATNCIIAAPLSLNGASVPTNPISTVGTATGAYREHVIRLERRLITKGDLSGTEHQEQAKSLNDLSVTYTNKAKAHRAAAKTSQKHADAAKSREAIEEHQAHADWQSRKADKAETKSKAYAAARNYHVAMGKAVKTASEISNIEERKGPDHKSLPKKQEELAEHLGQAAESEHSMNRLLPQ